MHGRDGWAVIFGTVRRRLGGAAARPNPFSLYQQPTHHNGQCTNFVLFDVPLVQRVKVKVKVFSTGFNSEERKAKACVLFELYYSARPYQK